MCLLSFSWQPENPQLLAMTANRDEFHARPTAESKFWAAKPHILAGQDLQSGGTWMGVTQNGRFAALTNVRQLPATQKSVISRGQLVLDFLDGQTPPLDYLTSIAKRADYYDGFNLIVGTTQTCGYYSNRSGAAPILLNAGLYGLSNHLLDTPWPKVEYAKDQLNAWQTTRSSLMQTSATQLSQLLNRKGPYNDELLPDTGVGLEWERMLSSPFITTTEYGTRASTGLCIIDNKVGWVEQSFDSTGAITNTVNEHFTIAL